MCVERVYRKYSSLRESQIRSGFLSTPISMANSGHKSRTSSRNGRPRRNATAHAAKAWKMGGEVPITTSIGPDLRAVRNDDPAKVPNENTRQIKLRWSAG